MNSEGQYRSAPEPPPPAPPVVDDVFWARVTGNSSLGSGRWSYTFAEAEKTVAAYAGWTTLSGGRTGTAYTRTTKEITDVADAVKREL